MKLASNNFKNNDSIPHKFTCEGDNISPHLSWSEYPPETKSFAIVCHDPDAVGREFLHWIIVNIPVSINELAQGADVSKIGYEIENDFGYNKYGGPCPPSGIHRYIFSIYALSIEELSNITRENYKWHLQKYEVDYAKLIGFYTRKNQSH